MSNKSKHFEPSRQQARSKEKPGAEKKHPISSKKMALLGVATVLLIGYGLEKWNSTVSTPDVLSEPVKEQLVTTFNAMGHLKLDQVPAKDIDAAITATPLSKEQQAKLRNDVQQGALIPTPLPGLPIAGQSRLVWLELNDFASQDGDVVSISSAGYQVEIGLLNAPIRIAIPMDQSGVINVTGVHDGGGGITLGFRNSLGNYSMPVLTEGQILTIPVSL